MTNRIPRDAARKTLGSIRLIFGGLGLIAPDILMRRMSVAGENGTAADTTAKYAFRLFGVRTVVIGLELLFSSGPSLDRAASIAPIIHGSDTVAAVLAARSGRLPKRMGLMMVAVSAFNTVLSLIGLPRRGASTSGKGA